MNKVADPSRVRSVGKVLFEIAVIAGLVATAVSFWPRGSGTYGAMIGDVDLPMWASVQDLLLTGPDAGEWAQNTLHVYNGRYGSVDPHRMPTKLLLTAPLIGPTGSVVLAGHLLNHLLHVLLVLTVYAVGRAGGGVGVGLAAVGLGALLPDAIADSRTYGADILIAVAIPLAVVGSLIAARRWWLGPIGGLLAALGSLSHFTTLPYALPGLVLVALRGPRSRWRRPLAVLTYAAGTVGTIWLIYRFIPPLTLKVLQNSIAEVLAPEWRQGGTAPLDLVAELKAASRLPILESAVAGAVNEVRPDWLPWGAAVLAVWLGVLGPGLGRAAPEGSGRLRQVLTRCDLGLGIPLLLCLTPLPMLAAHDAPPRYATFVLSMVGVLVARGLLSPLALVDLELKKRWTRWPRHLVVVAAGAVVFGLGLQAVQDWKKATPPNLEGLRHAQLSRLLTRHLPPGSGVATNARAALVMADLALCPRTHCPMGSTPGHFRNCLRILDQECPGEAPLAWVTTDWDQLAAYAVDRQAMSRWIEARWEVAGRVSAGGRAHRLFLIERDDLDREAP